MPELKRLHAGHSPAVLAFELANRTYFAASISDRGDDFFDQFTDRYNASLAEQEAGICAFYVLVAEDGSVLGRFNLYDLEDGTARLGYRVAERVAGRGVATATVRELCRMATVMCDVRPAHTAGGHLPRQRRVPESLGQGRVRLGWPCHPGRSRRQVRHLVPARPPAIALDLARGLTAGRLRPPLIIGA